MNNNIVFEEIKVELPELRTWLDGKEVFPTLTELRLLMVFLSDPYHGFPRGELIRRLQLTSVSSLSVTICNLRKRFNQKYIVTVHGVGYAFAEKGRN